MGAIFMHKLGHAKVLLVGYFRSVEHEWTRFYFGAMGFKPYRFALVFDRAEPEEIPGLDLEGYRMIVALGEEAAEVLGIDPARLYAAQKGNRVATPKNAPCQNFAKPMQFHWRKNDFWRKLSDGLKK
jgi:hypothetical protein